SRVRVDTLDHGDASAFRVGAGEIDAARARDAVAGVERSASQEAGHARKLPAAEHCLGNGVHVLHGGQVVDVVHGEVVTAIVARGAVVGRASELIGADEVGVAAGRGQVLAPGIGSAQEQVAHTAVQ